MDLKGQVTQRVKGLKISLVSKWLIVVIAILAVCLFFAIGDVNEKYTEMMQRTNDYVELDNKAHMVSETSDYLTSEARLYVQTGNVLHARLYFEEKQVTRQREQLLAELDSMYQAVFLDDGIRKATQQSQLLMEQEIYAMKLAAIYYGEGEALPPELAAVQLTDADGKLQPRAMLQKAEELLYSESYQQEKTAIHEQLTQFTQELMAAAAVRMAEGRAALVRSSNLQRFLITLMVLMSVFSFMAVAFLVLTPLRVHLDCVREKKPLREVGSQEFRYLARVYNEIYAQREDSVQKEAIFRHKAAHDQMTGLLNRVSAEERIRELMEQPDHYGILILLDLDDLKGINDTFGHQEGDRAILGISETLKSHFRDSDVVGRLGGDEFIIYLPGAAANSETIGFSLTSLLRKLSGIAIGTGDERRVHCSIGCAIQAPSTSTFEALFQQADTALYHVKRSGKNHFAFYTAEMEQADYRFREQKLLTQQSERKFDTVELQELLNSIAVFYQLMMSANLSANSYHLIEEVDDGVFSKVPTFGALDAFIRMAGKPVHPDDEAGYFENLSRKALLQAYQRGEKAIRHHFRYLQGESYRWAECNVIFYTNDQGDVCDITMLRWADERAHELERLWMQRMLDLAVVSGFEYICLVNLETREYYLHGGRQNTHDAPNQGDFDQVTRSIRDRFIQPEEREDYYQNARIETITARMKADGVYSYRYAMPDGLRLAMFRWSDEKQHQVLMTIQKLEGEDYPKTEKTR